jgi:outer membrane protein OmpA-like peptidoglycan-associated protein
MSTASLARTNRPRLRKQSRLLVQSMTYLTIGLMNALFVMFFLAPRASEERSHKAKGVTVTVASVDDAGSDSAGSNGASDTGSDGANAAQDTGSDSANTAQGTGSDSANTAKDTGSDGADPAKGSAGTATDTTDTAAKDTATDTTVKDTTVKDTGDTTKDTTNAKDTEPRPAKPLPEPVVVRFPIASSVISTGSFSQLRQVGKALAADKTLHVKIIGHSDARGSADENTTLSEQRAKAAALALESMGVSEARISTSGAGSSQPLDPSDSPVALARNRRVEIAFVREETP